MSSEKGFIDQLCQRMTVETATLVVRKANQIQEHFNLRRSDRDWMARQLGDLVADVVTRTAELFKEVEEESKR